MDYLKKLIGNIESFLFRYENPIKDVVGFILIVGTMGGFLWVVFA